MIDPITKTHLENYSEVASVDKFTADQEKESGWHARHINRPEDADDVESNTRDDVESELGGIHGVHPNATIGLGHEDELVLERDESGVSSVALQMNLEPR